MIYLKEIRTEKGMSIEELSEKSNLSKPQLWSYESGRREPPIDALIALADILDVTLDRLIRGKEKDRPEERSFESVSNMITRKVKKKAISAFRVWGNINTLPK